MTATNKVASCASMIVPTDYKPPKLANGSDDKIAGVALNCTKTAPPPT
jgi:hypothetical protein